MPAPFELDHVTRRFGDVVALDDVSLSIEDCEHVAMIGPSGAGKSTLLNLLNGAILPTDGRVLLGGRAVLELGERERRAWRRQTATVYQHLHLVPTLSALHNVLAGRLGHWSLARSLVSLVFPQDRHLAMDALDAVGIPDKAQTRVDRLSGGERQRVAIARALVQQPLALLADEPVSSVDPARAESLVTLLVTLARERGITLVVSLHSLPLARSHFGRLIGLRQGAVAFDRSGDAVGKDDIASLYLLANGATVNGGEVGHMSDALAGRDNAPVGNGKTHSPCARRGLL